MKKNTFIFLIMSVVCVLSMFLKIEASELQNDHVCFYSDTNFNKFSGLLKQDKMQEMLGQRSRSFGDLRPVPTLMNILWRYRQTEEVLNSLTVVETDVSMLMYKQKLREILVDVGTTEQKYGFNELKDVNQQVTLEGRLESYEGSKDIIEVLMGGQLQEAICPESDKTYKSNYKELKSLLCELRTAIDEAQREAKLQQENLESIASLYVNKLFNMVDKSKKKRLIKNKVDELLVFEEQLIAGLKKVNAEAKKVVKISEKNVDDLKVKSTQYRVTELKEALLLTRAKVRAAIQWLMDEQDELL